MLVGHHPNIVKFHGYFWNELQTILYIVLEYCDRGDLYSLINLHKATKSNLKELYIWHIFHQICLAVSHLHEHQIVHRDIKSLNIMLTRNYITAKLADLGVSRQLVQREDMLSTIYGTPLYLSPELMNSEAYNSKTDIWSLGVLLYEMCALQPPFQGGNMAALATQVKAGVTADIPSSYSRDMQTTVRWLLQVSTDTTRSIHIFFPPYRLHSISFAPVATQLISFRLTSFVPEGLWTFLDKLNCKHSSQPLPVRNASIFLIDMFLLLCRCCRSTNVEDQISSRS